jgi:hypothetical protein
MVGEHLVICVRCALYIETISVDVHLRFQIKTGTDPVSEHLFFFNLCIFKQWMINEVQNWTMPNATHHRHNPNRYDGSHVVHLLESNANLVCTQIYLHHITHSYLSPFISLNICQSVFTDLIRSRLDPVLTLSLLRN